MGCAKSKQSLVKTINSQEDQIQILIKINQEIEQNLKDIKQNFSNNSTQDISKMKASWDLKFQQLDKQITNLNLILEIKNKQHNKITQKNQDLTLSLMIQDHNIQEKNEESQWNEILNNINEQSYINQDQMKLQADEQIIKKQFNKHFNEKFNQVGQIALIEQENQKYSINKEDILIKFDDEEQNFSDQQ